MTSTKIVIASQARHINQYKNLRNEVLKQPIINIVTSYVVLDCTYKVYICILKHNGMTSTKTVWNSSTVLGKCVHYYTSVPFNVESKHLHTYIKIRSHSYLRSQHKGQCETLPANFHPALCYIQQWTKIFWVAQISRWNMCLKCTQILKDITEG